MAQEALQQALDIKQGKEGLQLPPNFEDKLKTKENRDILVTAVKNKFEQSEFFKNNKDAISSACKKEISSWGETMPQDPGKIAVLYLYSALNGKVLYKEKVSSAFDEFKKENKTTTTIDNQKKDPISENPTTVPNTEINNQTSNVVANNPKQKTEADNQNNPDSRTTKPISANETDNTPKESLSQLQTDLNKIPALQKNPAINSLVNDITKLEKQRDTLGTALKDKIAERDNGKQDLATKQDALNQLEAQIKDIKNIDDKFARKGVMERLSQQKDTLNKEIDTIQKKVDTTKDQIDDLIADINQIKTEITENKDRLVTLLEPIQRIYDKNINTIQKNIGKYEKALNGNYSESQKTTMAPDFENWKKAEEAQNTQLTNTMTDKNNLTNLIANLGKKDNPTDNLASIEDNKETTNS